MSRLIKSLNYFSYNSLWRMGVSSHVNHSCGGFSTLLVFVAIIGLTIMKLIEMFQMTNLTFTVQAQKSLFAPFINVTTNQFDSITEPIMIAFNTYSEPNQLESDIQYNATFSLVRQTYDPDKKTWYQPKEQIGSQPCTPEHFSRLPGIKQNFRNWSMSSWICLPINRTFQIGGNVYTDTDQTYLNLQFICDSQVCSNNSQHSKLIEVFVVTTAINPSNISSPTTAQMHKYQATLQSNVGSKTIFLLDQNVVVSDKSLIPGFTRNQTKKSMITNDVITNTWFPAIYAKTEFHFSRSDSTYIYNRKFMKIIDVFAYLGGMFQSLIAIFFFMDPFGRYIYQITFAKRYFGRNKVKDADFLTYVKDSVYSVMKKLISNLQWQGCEERMKTKMTINKMLDIVYLLKRVQYLQKAVSVVLQTHQMKALYFTKKMAEDDFNDQFDMFVVRNRILDILTRVKMRKIREINLNADTLENANQNKKKVKKKFHYKQKQYKVDSNVRLQKNQPQTQVIDLDSFGIKESKQQMIEEWAQTESKDQDLDLQLKESVFPELKFLISEAENKNNNKSKRIYAKIQPQIISKLKIYFSDYDLLRIDLRQ